MSDEIREKLLELADEEYKKFHSKLCPSKKEILGVRVPILRAYARELANDDWKKYLDEACDKYYEEIMLQGMVIGQVKAPIEEIFEALDVFVPKIDNWAVCDITCSGLKIFKKHREKVWEYIKKFLNSKKEFEIRFAIIILLDYFLDDKYIDKVLEILDGIKHDAYYVKMGVAWTISVAYVKYPIDTMRYLKNNNLDDWTYNKVLQKITESTRVEGKVKDRIRDMKRKVN